MIRPTVRVALVAGAALLVATLTASVFVLARRGIPLGTAIEAALLPSAVIAAIAMAARFPCSSLPIRTTGLTRLVATHVASAVAAGGLWVVLWNWSLPLDARRGVDIPATLAAGFLLYAASVTIQYLLLEVEAARSAEQQALRYRVLAREAELKAFKAQIDPHFLYNSLNSVAALCSARPAEARKMAQLLADFFRQTLKLGGEEQIRLEEEIQLVERYLAIEQVRFGERLAAKLSVDDAARDCAVPPLILQPLVENAVRHGIASLVGGGTVEVTATRQNGVLRIRVENPADPERVRKAGEGIGLQNARGRLAAISGGRGALTASEANGLFRVELEMPA